MLSVLSAGKGNDNCQSALCSRELFCTSETKICWQFDKFFSFN